MHASNTRKRRTARSSDEVLGFALRQTVSVHDWPRRISKFRGSSASGLGGLRQTPNREPLSTELIPPMMQVSSAVGRQLPHYTIDISNRQAGRIPRVWLRRAATYVLHAANVKTAEVSIAVVDDLEMQTLNRKFLQHDWPTDVLSFLLEGDARDGALTGEVVVNAETACRVAKELGATARAELLLYVIHGALHLVGYSDGTTAARRKMRRAEQSVFEELSLPPPNFVESTSRSRSR